MKAPINNIIPFSNVDGLGNRLSIFFQTCPFSCLFCHNPETINPCIHCQVCVPTCPSGALSVIHHKVVWNKSLCTACDTCIRVCPHLSSPKISWMDVTEVIEEIKKVQPFIRGITVSGGECMNHAAFLEELFREVKNMNLTCLIDSNGAHDFSIYPELLALSDGVMLDMKAFDEVFHQELTGASNRMVKKNLSYLLKQEKLIEVRTIIFPELPIQNERTIAAVASLIGDNCHYKLINYRPFGVREEGIAYLGKSSASEEEMVRYQKLAISYGAIHCGIT